MDAYEIPSREIVAHWWRRYELPKLIQRAEEARTVQEEARQTLARVAGTLEALKEENETWQRRVGLWLSRYGRDL